MGSVILIAVGGVSNEARFRTGRVEPVYSAGDIEGKLQSLDRSGVTLTIIDTAGGTSAATTAAIRYADLCPIPVS